MRECLRRGSLLDNLNLNDLVTKPLNSEEIKAALEFISLRSQVKKADDWYSTNDLPLEKNRMALFGLAQLKKAKDEETIGAFIEYLRVLSLANNSWINLPYSRERKASKDLVFWLQVGKSISLPSDILESLCSLIMLYQPGIAQAELSKLSNN